MMDVEIQSLLEEAGYDYDPVQACYITIAGEPEEHSSEYIADELQIPLEDLQRWEIEQQEVDAGG
jgi:hypothetical protein